MRIWEESLSVAYPWIYELRFEGNVLSVYVRAQAYELFCKTSLSRDYGQSPQLDKSWGLLNAIVPAKLDHGPDSFLQPRACYHLSFPLPGSVDGMPNRDLLFATCTNLSLVLSGLEDLMIRTEDRVFSPSEGHQLVTVVDMVPEQSFRVLCSWGFGAWLQGQEFGEFDHCANTMARVFAHLTGSEYEPQGQVVRTYYAKGHFLELACPPDASLYTNVDDQKITNGMPPFFRLEPDKIYSAEPQLTLLCGVATLAEWARREKVV